MRRKYFGLALAAMATISPAGVFQSAAWAGDREIANQIIERLQKSKDSGDLKDFTLDMKVDDGVVLFRGKVTASEQKKLVLAAADEIDGVANIVDEVTVTAKTPAAKPEAKVVRPEAKVAKQADEGFSFREALARTAEKIRRETEKVAPAKPSTPEVMPGKVMPTAAAQPVEDTDQVVTDGVRRTLTTAQQQGKLRGFIVDVSTADGVVDLVGKASSKAQRDLIVRMVKSVPGVTGVRESIDLIEPMQAAPAKVRPVANLQQLAAAPSRGAPVMNTPYRMNPSGQAPAMPTNHIVGAAPAAPVMGQPVPVGGYAGTAMPRYDQPNLPNYAWPGYAAYPNYAAVTYPQQYSPSAFPYIGPFYPYPQVPLGWRKVSLEWDDGWWYLDFTDR